MGLSEKMSQIKSETDALIDFANAKTGAEDTTLGDAVKTLVDGFGQGGGSGSDDWELIDVKEKTINLSRDTTFDTITPSTSNQTVYTQKNGAIVFDFNNPIDLYENDVMFLKSVECIMSYKSQNPPIPHQVRQRSISVSQISHFDIHYGESSSASNAYFPLNVAYNTVSYVNTANGNSLVTNLTYGTVINITSSPGTIRTSANQNGSSDGTGITRRYLTRQEFPDGTITSRANASYFSVDSIKDIDSENTNFVIKIYAYKRENNGQNDIYRKALNYCNGADF